MKLSILFLLLGPLSGICADKNVLTDMWREGDIYHPMAVHSGTKAIISKKCAESSFGCQALTAVKKNLNLTFTEAQLSGGKNPTSLVCTIGHKGDVVILKDINSNENSFCKFPDLSMVNANDLR